MKNAQYFYELGEPVKRRWSNLSTPLYLIIVLVLAALIFFGSGIFGAIVSVVANLLRSGYDDATGALTAAGFTRDLIAGFLPIFILVYFALRFLEGRGLASVGMERKNALRNYVRGLGVGLLMFGSVVLLLWLLGYATIENPFNRISIAGAFVVLIGWVVQGAAEEVLTRGFVMQIIGRMTNSTIAIIISSIFFAVMHGANPGIGVVPLINLMVVSVFFALYVLYEGGLWGAFGAHSIWNWAQGNLFGFEVSGNVLESAIVLDLMETGARRNDGRHIRP